MMINSSETFRSALQDALAAKTENPDVGYELKMLESGNIEVWMYVYTLNPPEEKKIRDCKMCEFATKFLQNAYSMPKFENWFRAQVKFLSEMNVDGGMPEIHAGLLYRDELNTEEDFRNALNDSLFCYMCGDLLRDYLGDDPSETLQKLIQLGNYLLVGDLLKLHPHLVKEDSDVESLLVQVEGIEEGSEAYDFSLYAFSGAKERMMDLLESQGAT
jgi:hypothetical protein